MAEKFGGPMLVIVTARLFQRTESVKCRQHNQLSQAKPLKEGIFDEFVITVHIAFDPNKIRLAMHFLRKKLQLCMSIAELRASIVFINASLTLIIIEV